MPLRGETAPNRRLRLLILSASLIPLVVAGLAYVAHEAAVHYSNIVHGIAHKAEHIAKHVSVPLAANDALAVKSELALWSLHEDVVSAAIYDANDNLIASYTSAGARAAATPPKPSGRFSVLDAEMTEVIPVLLRDRRVGSVSLSANMTPVYQHVVWVVGIGALVMAASLAWAFLLALRFERRIALRIRNFIGAANAASHESDFSMRLPRDEADELSELTDPFNALLEQAEAKNRELIKAKEAAEAAARTKADFMDNMSHEIRTPMTSVIGITDLLSTTDLTPKQRAYVDNIRSSGDMLLSVIDDILDFSKLETRDIVLERVEFAIDDVVEGVLDMLGYRAYSKNIELACVLEADAAAPVNGDSHRLREVLINLVGNAVKFTERGEVVIRVTKRSETDDRIVIRFAVEDTGIGISTEEKERLFKPFSQVDESTTRRFGGSGLGLVICKRLVERMGGEIAFESEIGKGSTFWFELPLQKRHAPLPEPDADAASLRDKRVLVVDDNPKILDCLCRNVASLRMRADPAPGAREAQRCLWRAAAEGDPYEFVLIDAQLTGIDGVSLARQIKDDPDAGTPRLILLSSTARPVEDGALARLGWAASLQKPVSPRRLRACFVGGQDETIRRTAETASTRIVAAATAGAREGEALRVLVAEDNAVNREMLLDMLHSLGHRADAVEDGLAVDPALAAEDYGLLLLDCQMPGKDGYQVAREIRQREGAEQHMIIIAVTASTAGGASARTRCLEAGMDDYLSKPVRLEQLATMLQSWSPVADERGGAANRPAESGASETAAIDPETWQRLRAAGGANPAAFMDKYIDLFVNDATHRLQVMRAALGDRQAELIAREAHALKAGCLQIGASSMAALCRGLQERGRGGSLEGVAASLQRLENEFGRTRETLAAERKKLA